MGDFQESADRLIRHFGRGRTLTLRRYNEALDKGDDSVMATVAETLTPIFTVDGTRTIEVEGRRETVRTLFLSGLGVGSGEPIDGAWTAQLPGEIETPIIGTIDTGNTGGPVSDWLINIGLRQSSSSDAAPGDPATDEDCTAIWDTDNPAITSDANGVILFPDSVGSNDLEQLVGSLSPDIVTGGHQGDGSDDILPAKAGGGLLSQIFNVAGYTHIHAIKTPASIGTNESDPVGVFTNEQIFGDTSGRVGVYFRSGGPVIGAFHHDGAYGPRVELPISLNQSLIVAVRYTGSAIEISIDGGAFVSDPAGDLSGDGGARLHRGTSPASPPTTAIHGYTATFDASKSDAEIAGFVAFLASKTP